jgi:hypothetical protein
MLGGAALAGADAVTEFVELLAVGAGVTGAELPAAAVATGLVCMVAAGSGGGFEGVATFDPQAIEPEIGSVHATSKAYDLNISILPRALHRQVTAPARANLSHSSVGVPQASGISLVRWNKLNSVPAQRHLANEDFVQKFRQVARELGRPTLELAAERDRSTLIRDRSPRKPSEREIARDTTQYANTSALECAGGRDLGVLGAWLFFA